MNSFLDTAKRNKMEFFFLFAFCFESYFLFGNLILSLCLFLILSLLVLYLLKKEGESKEAVEKKLASYCFFDSFIKGIEKSMPIRSSYESSSRYLISYQKTIPYEELSNENSLKMYSYQKYFDFILEKDRQNEAFLLNYHELRKSLNQEIDQLERKKRKIEEEKKIGIALSLLFPFLLILFLAIKKTNPFSSFLPLILSIFLFFLLYVSNHVLAYKRMENLK